MRGPERAGDALAHRQHVGEGHRPALEVALEVVAVDPGMAMYVAPPGAPELEEGDDPRVVEGGERVGLARSRRALRTSSWPGAIFTATRSPVARSWAS